jgi:hypothetical protein
MLEEQAKIEKQVVGFQMPEVHHKWTVLLTTSLTTASASIRLSISMLYQCWSFHTQVELAHTGVHKLGFAEVGLEPLPQLQKLVVLQLTQLGG